MGDAREHQEQRTPGTLGAPERPTDAELVGELLQGELHTEDGAALGLAGDPIELAAQGPAQRFDPFHGPMGEVREGAAFDLAVDEQAFAQEARRWRIAVWDGGDTQPNRYRNRPAPCQAQSRAMGEPRKRIRMT